MTDPTVLAADITGAVALVIAATTAVTTWLTLRRQGKIEEERRRHDRSMRLLESRLRAAVDFLAAAHRATRARQGLDTANISLDQSKSSSDQQVYQHFLVKVGEAREQAFAAADDAENAYAALRILIPSVADQARRYLDYCISATAHPDENKVERHRARQMVEETIQKALGDDLPDNWMFAEPAIERPRWWKISLPRRDKRHAIAGTPRQP
jgi:hypothetical protein